MFFIWNFSDSRPTRDIDLLGKTQNSVENLAQIVREICRVSCDEDGVKFNEDTIECEIIQEKNTYSGIRARFMGEVENARARMQIDVGFGDIVYPNPVNVIYPTLLSTPSPSILGYTPETLIAEKAHAMIRHGERNSRIKDYFDIWFLSHQFSFEGTKLAEAMESTYANRGMPIVNIESVILDHAFSEDVLKKKLWEAFVDKNRLSATPVSFEKMMDQIELFIGPIFEAKKKEKIFQLTWDPPGPWKSHVLEA